MSQVSEDTVTIVRSALHRRGLRPEARPAPREARRRVHEGKVAASSTATSHGFEFEARAGRLLPRREKIERNYHSPTGSFQKPSSPEVIFSTPATPPPVRRFGIMCSMARNTCGLWGVVK
jgi:hypothetical protein